MHTPNERQVLCSLPGTCQLCNLANKIHNRGRLALNHTSSCGAPWLHCLQKSTVKYPVLPRSRHFIFFNKSSIFIFFLFIISTTHLMFFLYHLLRIRMNHKLISPHLYLDKLLTFLYLFHRLLLLRIYNFFLL